MAGFLIEKINPYTAIDKGKGKKFTPTGSLNRVRGSNGSQPPKSVSQADPESLANNQIT